MTLGQHLLADLLHARESLAEAPGVRGLARTFGFEVLVRTHEVRFEAMTLRPRPAGLVYELDARRCAVGTDQIMAARPRRRGGQTIPWVPSDASSHAVIFPGIEPQSSRPLRGWRSAAVHHLPATIGQESTRCKN